MKWTKRWRWVTVKPVLLGPVTYLWLGKVKGEQFDRLSLLNDILPVYKQVLIELGKRGIQWVQIDEPALVLELPQAWLDAFKPAYDALTGREAAADHLFRGRNAEPRHHYRAAGSGSAR